MLKRVGMFGWLVMKYNQDRYSMVKKLLSAGISWFVWFSNDINYAIMYEYFHTEISILVVHLLDRCALH